MFEDTACMIRAHLKHLQTADIADLNSVTIATVSSSSPISSYGTISPIIQP